MNKEEQFAIAGAKGRQTMKEYGEITQACKEVMQQRRARSPVQVERTPEVLEAIEDYVEDRRRSGRPLTHAGFMLAMGLTSDVYYKLRDYDHVIEEYKIIHGLPEDATTYTDQDGNERPLVLWSTIKEKCDALIQEQLEENCYTNRGNPAGSIFGLKARFQWSEDGTPQHVVNNLVIADGEQAQKALKMLMRP